MLKQKLIIKLLILAMCTSLVPTTIVFAEEKDNTKEIVTSSVQTTGTVVGFDEETTTEVEPSKVYEGDNSSENVNSDTEFYLSKKIGYRLKVTAAAAGSRAYSLEGTSDGGATWKNINYDPFLGEIGVASGITFVNDKLGFLCLSHSGGNVAVLYGTEDGGISYKKIDLPEVKVTLSDELTYNPFDFPEMPYEEDGNLNILVGQGADGDYNGGCKALYQSKDEGKTWQYIKEVTRS